MDYQTFKTFSQQVPKTMLRLDDLNPFTLGTHFHQGKEELLANDWLRNQLPDGKRKVIEGLGVRDLLDKTFASLSKTHRYLALPIDVYPVYFEIGRRHFQQIISFSTYPTLNCFHVEATDVVLLLPNPLIPIGRYLQTTEIELLKIWLTGKNRTLIIDACYDFYGKVFADEFRQKNVISLHSISKIFLHNKSKGWAITSNENFNIDTGDSGRNSLPSPLLPTLLQTKFTKAWKEINPLLTATYPPWKSPEVGYLGIIHKNHQALMKENAIFAIPATVFGSQAHDFSIISILNWVKNGL